MSIQQWRHVWQKLTKVFFRLCRNMYNALRREYHWSSIFSYPCAARTSKRRIYILYHWMSWATREVKRILLTFATFRTENFWSNSNSMHATQSWCQIPCSELRPVYSRSFLDEQACYLHCVPIPFFKGLAGQAVARFICLFSESQY